MGVQLKTTYWTTSLRRIQEISSSRSGRVGFDLDPRVELGGKNNTTEVKILSCQRWTCQTQRSVSGPAVLTISIPTGFALSESQRLRMTVEEGLNIWTTDSEIVFFFDKLSTEHTCVDFTLRRIFPVAKMSPYIPFKIADWYTPDRSNSTLVFLPEVNAVTICEVCGSYQCPNCEHVSSPSSSVSFDYASHASSTHNTPQVLFLMFLPFIMRTY